MAQPDTKTPAESAPPPHSSDPGHLKTPRGGVRALIDAGICLYVAVILFRTFELEGYIISTGSMAPDLLGFHKRVVCPKCGYEFAHGIPVNEMGMVPDTTDELSQESPGHVRCPNCGEDRIDIRSVPPNHGDQLLVLKNVYEFRQPRRWEVVVLKSPSRPTPFVKRVVGLPNESVQIKDGDIYVDGEICRKSLAQQRAARILVNDNNYVPDDAPDGQSCWSIEHAKSGWSANRMGFVFSPTSAAATASHRTAPTSDEIDWLAFRRWLRRGGRFRTTVPIADAKPLVSVRPSAFPQVRYDQAGRKLEATGAIDRATRDELLALNSPPAVRAAIDRLFTESHVAPITDDYGYNRAGGGLVSLPVRDLFLECDVALGAGDGDAVFEISDGRLTFRVVLNREKHYAELDLVGQRKWLYHAAYPAGAFDKPFKLELSTFDCAVLAAMDGTLLFPPWECPTDRTEPSRVPVRIGARGVEMKVSHLCVYRDIYYTRGQGRNAVDQPIRLGPDEFFMLGDNSPVSNDGRNWDEAAIQRSQLIGKPLVVHLPSRPGRISFGGFTRYVRVPDFSRIRYIR